MSKLAKVSMVSNKVLRGEKVGLSFLQRAYVSLHSATWQRVRSIFYIVRGG